MIVGMENNGQWGGHNQPSPNYDSRVSTIITII